MTPGDMPNSSDIKSITDKEFDEAISSIKEKHLFNRAYSMNSISCYV